MNKGVDTSDMIDVTTLPVAVDVQTAATLMENGSRVTLLDVRTPAEFESVHIPGSYNVPLDRLSEHRDELRSALTDPVILVCRSGMRARQAEQALAAAGLSRLHVLDGGLSAWESAGKPVKRGQQKWSLERQVRGVAGALVLAGAVGGLTVWPPLTLLAAAVGGGLTFSAITDTCGMAILLSKLPYNRGATCDIRDVVTRLEVGDAQ